MRAAVISAEEVTVETVPDPSPGPRDVVVAMAGCGICGTDLHIADGEFAPELPVTPGHEFAGEVVARGRDVTEVSVGDQVAVDPSLSLSCAVRGFDVLAPRLGDHYLVYGAGTMGLMMMEPAKRAGAASVSVVDVNPAALEQFRAGVGRKIQVRP